MLAEYSSVAVALLHSPFLRGIWAFDHFVETNLAEMFVWFSTHRQFLEVPTFQSFVEMLWDVLPGGKPIVSLFLPSDMVVLPARGGECSSDLNMKQ